MFKINKGSILGILMTGDTTLVRFWFSLWSFSWGLLLATDNSFLTGHLALTHLLSNGTLSALFFLHSFALMYGIVAHRFNTFLLFLEGILGVFLWAGLGISEVLHHHIINPTVFGGLTALFLLIRYPTHYTIPRKRRQP